MSVRRIVGTSDKPVVVVVEQIDSRRQWWIESYGTCHVNLAVQRVVTTTDDPLSMAGIKSRVQWMFSAPRA